jgi:hypothetical protein
MPRTTPNCMDMICKCQNTFCLGKIPDLHCCITRYSRQITATKTKFEIFLYIEVRISILLAKGPRWSTNKGGGLSLI